MVKDQVLLFPLHQTNIKDQTLKHQTSLEMQYWRPRHAKCQFFTCMNSLVQTITPQKSESIPLKNLLGLICLNRDISQRCIKIGPQPSQGPTHHLYQRSNCQQITIPNGMHLS